jgi:hypothetical protein
MCSRCVQLDDKLRHFRKIAGRADDKVTNDGIDALALEYEAQKLAFHLAGKELGRLSSP